MSEDQVEHGNRFVLRLDAIRDAIRALQGTSVHETFPLYLHLRRVANDLGRFDDLPVELNGEVHQWLEMPGGPPNKPHFRPFTIRGGPASLWLGSNLAGSYAPSSLRTSTSSLYLNSLGKYRLPTLASGTLDVSQIRTILLGTKKIPAWAVAAFLFRNRSFIGPTAQVPGWNDLLDVLKDLFGWSNVERMALFTWDVPIHECFEVDSYRE